MDWSYSLSVFLLSESRHDEHILADLKKMEQMPVKQKDIDLICKRHSLKCFETSAQTGYGVETCLNEAVSIIKEHRT